MILIQSRGCPAKILAEKCIARVDVRNERSVFSRPQTICLPTVFVSSEIVEINFHGPRAPRALSTRYEECRPWNLNAGRGGWSSFQGKNNAVDNSRLRRNRVPSRRKLTLFLTANHRAIYSCDVHSVGRLLYSPLPPLSVTGNKSHSVVYLVPVGTRVHVMKC